MSSPPGKGSGHRGFHQKVRNARRRTASSQRWLQRQLNDPYVARAKEAGYRSRAAFKLIEIDDKHRLLAPGRRVIDLGAAPGGWSQVAAHRVKSPAEQPQVVAIDYLPMEPIEGVRFIQDNVETEGVAERLVEALGGAPQLILSDMAAPTTGHRQTDHLRTQHLAEAAAGFAIDVLAAGGSLLVKTFRGGAGSDLLSDLKRHFDKVVHVKPDASRSSSVELYLLARGKRATKDP